MSDSTAGCDVFTLTLNLRSISPYYYEQMKERLRCFTERIRKRLQANTKEYTSTDLKNQPIGIEMYGEESETELMELELYRQIQDVEK